MCEKLLPFAQAQDMLKASGLTAWRAKLLLQRGIIPAHPHGMHAKRLWLKSTVKTFLDTHLKTPHPDTVVPGEELSRPPGVTTSRS